MKQVVIMRTDLNMRKGKMIAQGAHASMAAVLENRNHPYVEEWLANSFTKIVVGINSEDALIDLFLKARGNSMICSLIRDNGKTEFHDVKTVTCIAIGPAPDGMFIGLTDNL